MTSAVWWLFGSVRSRSLPTRPTGDRTATSKFTGCSTLYSGSTIAIRKSASAHTPTKKGTPRSNLPCWIYGQLNQFRNDFLRGNRVTPDHLITKRSQRAIQSYASVLYRMAVASFVGLKFKEKLKDAPSRPVWEPRQFDFDFHKRDCEAALSSICYTAQEWNDIQHGQLSPDVKKWP